ncbi:MAG: hypothetical protein ACRDDY_03375 [Clostridium sp.]|uniref:hypothetical protein n=1 Tax=Clostridium sp. TaxID=1506 RepID=UPI003EE7B2F5
MSKYYIRLKTKSNEFVLGYKFSKTKRSFIKISRYGEGVFTYKTEEAYLEEWRLKRKIFDFTNDFDRSLKNTKLKEFIVSMLKPFAKKHGLKLKISKLK